LADTVTGGKWADEAGAMARRAVSGVVSVMGASGSTAAVVCSRDPPTESGTSRLREAITVVVAWVTRVARLSVWPRRSTSLNVGSEVSLRRARVLAPERVRDDGVVGLREVNLACGSTACCHALRVAANRRSFSGVKPNRSLGWLRPDNE